MDKNEKARNERLSYLVKFTKICKSIYLGIVTKQSLLFLKYLPHIIFKLSRKEKGWSKCTAKGLSAK